MSEVGFANTELPAMSSQAAAMVARAQAEVQGMIISAKRWPRDSGRALKQIEAACADVRLAEDAAYSFNQGGTDVTGPTIRLLEVVAQFWGNMNWGFQVLERIPGGSIVEAYAYDYETNNKRNIIFQVDHVRETKKGTFNLTSSRQIYELEANQASRRTRNCMQAVIPRHIVDAAVAAAEKTLKNTGSIDQKRNKIIEAFAKIDVSVDDLERRIGKKLAAISDVDYIQLQKIWKSINDGMSDKNDWFAAVLDPEKIKKAQADGGTAIETPAEAEKDADHRRAAMIKFIEQRSATIKLGGAPIDIIGTFNPETATAQQLIIAADTLKQWEFK